MLHPPKSQDQRLVGGKGEGKRRERHCPRIQLLCPLLSWGFQVNGCAVGAGSQDVDDILPQEGGPVHRSGRESKDRLVRLVAEPGGSWDLIPVSVRLELDKTPGALDCA